MADQRILKMASTTSTDNTGLLAYLASLFQGQTGISIQWIATGSGRAFDLGRHCDVDVLLVHAPEAELEFMESGYGDVRHEVMYNDFVIAGPPHDPAQIKGQDHNEALTRIREKRVPFVSRADDSGTHKKELRLWRAAGFHPENASDWYVKANKGMLDSLELAAIRDGYVLTDRGTLLSFRAQAKNPGNLVVLLEGGDDLRNQYGVIVVNQKMCPHVRHEPAEEFVTWLTSKEGQSAIADFRLQGEKLFIPNAHAG